MQGMDALTHAVEAYVSTISNPVTGKGAGTAGRNARYNAPAQCTCMPLQQFALRFSIATPLHIRTGQGMGMAQCTALHTSTAINPAALLPPDASALHAMKLISSYLRTAVADGANAQVGACLR